METFYSSEKNTQMIISLLKQNGIKKVIASPGATNVCFVASLQQDPFFELYSAVDERSAAYMACGLAAESGEVVVLTCTGATASRNYLPGLTEAYYRKLPILSITATQHIGKIGNLYPQVIDRTNPLNDITVYNVVIPSINSEEDEWAYGLAINKAIIALKENGGGPVHIDLTTEYSTDYSVRELPLVNAIHKYTIEDKLPYLDANKKIAIFVGNHLEWNESLEKYVDLFCEKYDAVVFKDHTSNYKGKYGVQYSLVAGQAQYRSKTLEMDILIHIGEISGAYMKLYPKEVWRVNSDGVARDYFRKITNVFGMKEENFFRYYCDKTDDKGDCKYYCRCAEEYEQSLSKIPEIPFSNIWIAQQLHHRLPINSTIHFGILNSLRSWNFFEIDKSILGYSNTGGFGIDGIMSTVLGGALAKPNRLHFCILGDLAFFYDMNVLGNRHVLNNMRILVVNNGVGTEFKNYSHLASRFGDETDKYIAARGHFGNKNINLVKDFAQNLGFSYISANDKKSFNEKMELFIDEKMGDKSIIFEVFTDSTCESDALYLVNNCVTTNASKAKKIIKNMVGENTIEAVKKIVKKSQ